jgi:hypothetical protein
MADAMAPQLPLPKNQACSTLTSTKVVCDINNSDIRLQQGYIRSLKSDVELITELSLNVLERLNNLEHAMKTTSSLINTRNTMLPEQEGSSEDARGWSTVTRGSTRSRSARPLRPMSTNPTPIELHNRFGAFGEPLYEEEFPSLDVAAAFKARKNVNYSPPLQQHQHNAVQFPVPPPPIDFINNKYYNHTRKVFPPHQLQFKETAGHVLDAPQGYAKAHSVDQTLHMGAGIALDFRNEVGQVENLKNQRKKVGETAVVKDNNNDYILYMIAKRKHYYKPTPKHESLFKSNYIKALYGLRKTCINLKIKKLAIPKMGCNLDNLSWENFMKPSILKIFDTVKMEILVCDSTQRTPRKVNNRVLEHVKPTTPTPSTSTPTVTTLSSTPTHTPVLTPASSAAPNSTAHAVVVTANSEPTESVSPSTLHTISVAHPHSNIPTTTSSSCIPSITLSSNSKNMSPSRELENLLDTIATLVTPQSRQNKQLTYTTLHTMNHCSPSQQTPDTMYKSPAVTQINFESPITEHTSKNQHKIIPFHLM